MERSFTIQAPRLLVAKRARRVPAVTLMCLVAASAARPACLAQQALPASRQPPPPAEGGSNVDVVVARTADGQRTTRMTGEIVELTGRQLLLRRPGGSVAELPAERIVSYETQWTAAYSQAREALADRDYATAASRLQEAMRGESRRWAQRLMIADFVRCQLNLGDLPRAVAAFEVLLKSDPQTASFDCIPLVWSSRPLSIDQRRAAGRWLQASTPAVRLIGASWLLATADRAAAAAELERLAKESPDNVAALAVAQLWRLKLVTVDEQAAQRFRQQSEALPFALRGGSYFLWGQMLWRLGRGDEAAAALLRVPIHYPHQRQLAAQSLIAAAGALESQPREAARLYREVVQEYASLPEAEEARAKLQSLATRSRETAGGTRP